MPQPCNICTRANCEGENKLRNFDNWQDLSDHLGEKEIVEFVNTLAKIRATQKRAAKKMHERERLILELEKELMNGQAG